MLNETTLAMRREFDLSFGQARRIAPVEPHNLLAVRVGDENYALRATEIAGLFVDRHIVPIPTQTIAFIGVASFRGQVAPVYDLASLLGYPGGTTARWLVLVRYRHPVAVAFTAVDAHLTVAPEQIVALAAITASSGLASSVSQAVQNEGLVRPIINLQSLIENVQRHIDVVRQPKEQNHEP